MASKSRRRSLSMYFFNSRCNPWQIRNEDSKIAPKKLIFWRRLGDTVAARQTSFSKGFQQMVRSSSKELHISPDKLDVMRRMIAEPPFCLNMEEARTYTLHNYRYVYNTAMRHMRFSCVDTEDAGHWKPCVEHSTLLNLFIRNRCDRGWRRVPPACLPTHAP